MGFWSFIEKLGDKCEKFNRKFEDDDSRYYEERATESRNNSLNCCANCIYLRYGILPSYFPKSYGGDSGYYCDQQRVMFPFNDVKYNDILHKRVCPYFCRK